MKWFLNAFGAASGVILAVLLVCVVVPVVACLGILMLGSSAARQARDKAREVHAREVEEAEAEKEADEPKVTIPSAE